MSFHHKLIALLYGLFPCVRKYRRVGCPYFLHPLDMAGPVEERLLRIAVRAHQRVYMLLTEVRFRLWLLKLKLFR